MTSAVSAADPSTSTTDQNLPPVASVVPLVPAWSVDRSFDYAVPAELEDSVEVGSLVRVPFGARRVRGLVLEIRRKPPRDELQEIISVPLKSPIAPAPLSALYEWLAQRYAVPLGRAFERAVPPRVRVKVEAPGSVNGDGGTFGLLASYHGGADLLAAVDRGVPGTWLVRALPTHPRSDLIAELVSAVGERGGTTLLAVPEVLHGSRVLEQVRTDFPALVRVDSAAGEMERAEGWMRMAAGHALAGGGRATVFVPTPRLSLILIDDEHDSVFKEDRSVRYDARRVAIERARLQGAICVFVSGSPTVEHGAAALEGRMGSVTPSREAARAARPIVEVVAPPADGGMGPELHERIRDVLRAGRSAALLAPARGYSRAIWCANCRRSLRCTRCEAGLVFDRARAATRCRRCGAMGDLPRSCPQCGADELHHLGRGSERYAEQLGKAFPHARVVHMDKPAADAGPRNWAGHGIYITTWFGTKPALRPEVSLVGVLDLDALTRRVDFRASEHAYQALTELAGWAGPASEGGRLLLQTEDPNHHATQAVVRADYDFFLARELEFRRELGYPPFTELIKLAAMGPSAREVLEQAIGIARALNARVLGPIEAPFPSGGRDQRDAGSPGLQVLLKCESAQPVAAGLRDILPRVPRGTRLRVDVDPR